MSKLKRNEQASIKTNSIEDLYYESHKVEQQCSKKQQVIDKLPKRSLHGAWHVELIQKNVTSDEDECKINQEESGFSIDSDGDDVMPTTDVEALCAQVLSEKDNQKQIQMLKKLRLKLFPKMKTNSDDNEPNNLQYPPYEEALAGYLSVILDLVPGYSIRPLTVTEKTELISKEVKVVREFEQGFLVVYRDFISELMTRIGSKMKQGSKQKHFDLVSFKALCQLFLQAYHFNYFEDILKTLIALALNDQNMAIEFANCMRQLFTQTDKQGKATMQTVRELSNQVKDRGYGTLDSSKLGHKLIFDSLLDLNLSMETKKNNLNANSTSAIADKDILRQEKRKREHRSRQERKRLRAELEQAAKQAQLDQITCKEQRQLWTGETLKFLFRLYFGVLQTEKPKLLTLVISGLCKYAPRLRAEYLADLNTYLRRIIMNTIGHKKNEKHLLPITESIDMARALLYINKISPLSSTRNVLSFPVISRSHTSVVVNTPTAMDLKFLYDFVFWKILDPTRLGLLQDAQLVTLDQLIQGLFVRQTSLPINRVCSFVHRFTTCFVCLIKEGNYCKEMLIKLLSWIQIIFEHHPAATCVIPEKHELLLEQIKHVVVDPDFDAQARICLLPIQNMFNVISEQVKDKDQLKTLNRLLKNILAIIDDD